MVARHIVLLVEEEGFELIDAPSARYAVTVLTACDDVNVLFTDADMPGQLTGLDLSHTAKTSYPEIAGIVVSGKLPSRFSGVAPEVRYMPKLYRMNEVIQVIHKTMAERPPQEVLLHRASSC
ncbi:response regulator [Microvirga vignae]|uniref:response regulator n=1 Tax=Microvirga vignae TaxID=1225564 RepID=UPI000B02B371|nr:response regulator [Microvirga vignae]